MMSRDNWRMWPLEWITHIIETCFHLYVHEIEKKKTHCFCFPDNCLFSAIWIYSLPVKHYHECGTRKITIFWDRKQTYIYTNIYIFFLLLLLVVETKLIRLCFSSPETKNVWSQSILQHMAEVIFFLSWIYKQYESLKTLDQGNWIYPNNQRGLRGVIYSIS